MSGAYTPEQIYEAMRRADAVGDAEAVKALAAELERSQLTQPDPLPGEGISFTVTDDTPADMAAKSIGNTALGYVQGAGEALVDFPLTIGAGAQVAVNSALGGTRALFNDMTGDPEEAARVRAQTQQMNDRAWDTAKPVANVFNALAPPPVGYETQRDVARFAGGFLVPGPKGAKAPIRAPGPVPVAKPVAGVIDNAAEVVAEGQRRGVPVMTTDIKPPKSGMGRMVKQTVPEKIPFAGMSGPRQAQQEARVQVVKDIVDEFGGNSARELFDSAGGAVDDIAKSLSTERVSRIQTRTAAKNAVIDGIKGNVATPRAIAAIDQEIAQLAKLEADEVRPVIAKLQNWKSALMGETQQINTGLLDGNGKPIIREIPPERSLRVIEDLRKLMGETFKDPSLAAIRSVGEKSLNRIYGPLREDMGGFIQQNAGAGARNRWSKANEELAAMAGELKATRFRNVLRDADMTPEAVGRILFSGPDNVSDMKRLVANLPPSGRRKVQAALMQRAFDSAGGSEGVSVERFLNNVTRNSAKFGVVFDGADRKALEGVKRLLEATRRGAEAGANVRTGEQNLPTVLGIGATSTLGVGGGVASLGVGGLLARIYESPMMRDRLLRLASTKPGSQQESRAMEVLMRSAAPIVTQWREAIPKALNDNPANLVAASEGQQPE